MENKDIYLTESLEVSCCGKEAPYDHPKIYLKIDKKKGEINCPYCNKKFSNTTLGPNH